MTGLVVRGSREAEALVRECEGRPVIVDLETKGLDPWSPESYICGAAVKPYGGRARYLSLRHPDSADLPATVLRDVWRAAA